MYITKQFSIFMVNKPGILAHVLSEFARLKINVVAMTVMDSVEHGVLRVVVDVPAKATEMLSRLNMTYNETDVLCLVLENKSGALADVAEKLAKEHINISYAYCTSGARGGKTTGVLKVADVQKAMRVLDSSQKKNDKGQSLRRPNFSR
jgi:hypothetical protein